MLSYGIGTLDVTVSSANSPSLAKPIPSSQQWRTHSGHLFPLETVQNKKLIEGGFVQGAACAGHINGHSLDLHGGASRTLRGRAATSFCQGFCNRMRVAVGSSLTPPGGEGRGPPAPCSNRWALGTSQRLLPRPFLPPALTYAGKLQPDSNRDSGAPGRAAQPREKVLGLDFGPGHSSSSFGNTPALHCLKPGRPKSTIFYDNKMSSRGTSRQCLLQHSLLGCPVDHWWLYNTLLF